jgi:hypothetical protein
VNKLKNDVVHNTPNGAIGVFQSSLQTDTLSETERIPHTAVCGLFRFRLLVHVRMAHETKLAFESLGCIVSRPDLNNPPTSRDCVKTQKIQKSGDQKSFVTNEKLVTGQIWTKSFFQKFVNRLFTQSLPVGGIQENSQGRSL